MIQKIKKIASGVLAAALILTVNMEAWAATKPINNVSVSVSSKLQVGKSLPDIRIGTGNAENGEVVVKDSGSYYTVTAAEWADSGTKEILPGDEPRMIVTLDPEDVTDHYFLASYKASNVKVSGGSFVSARREGDSLLVTLKVKPAKGDYDPPKDAYWNEKNLGEARWEEADSDSGYYELQLLRNNKNVYKVAKTSAKTYNFYP